jgi:predicted regulator of Ras-like GTPase activity (Roadblock/LC7/MglB family)
MEKGLQQLSAVTHVGGSFVCDNRGEVIVSSTPPVLATVTMNAIGREAAQAFEALDAAGQRATRLDFTYSTWRLLATDMGGEAILFAVCEPQVEMPVLRMTIDVVLAGWRKDQAAQKQLARHRGSRREVLARAHLDDVSQRSLKIIQSRT